MGSVATRLLSIVWTLQSRPLVTAGELAADLDVSERTVHRYMGMLDEMGIPIASERGRGGGFYLVRGYKLPPLRFTPEEASALYLGADVVRRISGLASYRDAAQAARAKLDGVLPDRLREQAAQAQQQILITGFERMDYGPWEDTLATLRQAMRDQRRLAMAYRTGGQAETAERIIDPYAMVHQWGYWYLVAYCHRRSEVRTFRVDRITGLTPLNEGFRRPTNFDVAEYLEQSMSQDWPVSYRVRLRFRPEGAFRARDARGWDSFVEREDGAVEVTYSASDLYWAARIALSYGSDAEVLEPPDVVERVREQVQYLINQYQHQER